MKITSYLWDIIYSAVAIIAILVIMFLLLCLYNLFCTIDVLNFETFLRITQTSSIEHPHYWYDYALILFLFIGDLIVSTGFAFIIMGVPGYCLNKTITEFIPFVAKAATILFFLLTIYDMHPQWITNLFEENTYISKFYHIFHFGKSVPSISNYVFGLVGIVAIILPTKENTAETLGRFLGRLF